jgi:hypothetical protein
MALSSQGTSVTFGTPLGKVVGINVDVSTPLKEIRTLAASLDECGRYLSTYEKTTCDQTVEVEVIATGFDSSVVGGKNTLTITGNGWTSTFQNAVMEKFRITAKVGDMLRATFSFRRSAA